MAEKVLTDPHNLIRVIPSKGSVLILQLSLLRQHFKEVFFMLQEFQTAVSNGDLNAIVASTIGQLGITVIALIILLIAMTFANQRKDGMPIRALTYSSLSIAIAFVLSQIKLFALMQGGAITPFSMLFIIIIGYFFGVKTGILAGVVYGLLQLAFGGWVMHPIQLLLDYPLAFGALGLSGIFANQKNGLIKGIIVGCAGRFLFHFIGGVVFFGSSAPEGWNSILYSAVYNISYIGIEGAATVALVMIPIVAEGFKRVKLQALELA